MHDRIRLALSAAGIAVVTLFASGAPLPFTQTAAQDAGRAQSAAIAASVEAKSDATTPVAEIPVSSEAAVPDALPSKPQIHAPRIRRTAGADLTSA